MLLNRGARIFELNGAVFIDNGRLTVRALRSVGTDHYLFSVDRSRIVQAVCRRNIIPPVMKRNIIFELNGDCTGQISEASLLFYGDQKRAPEGPHDLPMNQIF